MKKWIILVGLHLFTAALFSHQKVEPQPCPHHFTFGGNYTRAYIKPQANPSFQGNLGGMQGYYEYQRPDFFYAGVKADWRYGSTSGSDGKRDLLDVNVHERLGYTFKVYHPENLITLFTGFGYRQLRHHFKPKSGSSMTFRYNEFYIPVGFLSDFKVASFVSMGLNVTWMPQVFPTVTIDPLAGARWIIQGKYANFLFELPVTFHFYGYRKHLAIVVSPLFEIWQDGRSKAKTPSGTSLDLPGNTYIFWGGDVNIRYSF